MYRARFASSDNPEASRGFRQPGCPCTASLLGTGGSAGASSPRSSSLSQTREEKRRCQHPRAPSTGTGSRSSRTGSFLTDGGLETTLIFHEGWDLPIFQAFTLLESERGRAALRAYFDRYVPLAIKQGMGFVLESPTWRANPDWGAKVGYGRDGLGEASIAPPSI